MRRAALYFVVRAGVSQDAWPLALFCWWDSQRVQWVAAVLGSFAGVRCDPAAALARLLNHVPRQLPAFSRHSFAPSQGHSTGLGMRRMTRSLRAQLLEAQ
jgi:hypothetical protein